MYRKNIFKHWIKLTAFRLIEAIEARAINDRVVKKALYPDGVSKQVEEEYTDKMNKLKINDAIDHSDLHVSIKGKDTSPRKNDESTKSGKKSKSIHTACCSIF